MHAMFGCFWRREVVKREEMREKLMSFQDTAFINTVVIDSESMGLGFLGFC